MWTIFYFCHSLKQWDIYYFLFFISEQSSTTLKSFSFITEEARLYIYWMTFRWCSVILLFRWHAEPGRWLWACNTKKDTDILKRLKFRELSGLLIGKGMSLKSKGIIYTTCIRPAMLYGSETWPTKIEDIRKMQRSEMRMLRWMTGVSLSERKSNECVRSMVAIDDIGEVMWRNRLRWFGHVERRDELCWIKGIGTLQVDGDGVKGRPRKRWRELLKEDMREKGLCREDAWDRSRWRRMLWEGHSRGWPQYTGKKQPR